MPGNKLPTPQTDGVLTVPHLHIKGDSSQAAGNLPKEIKTFIAFVNLILFQPIWNNNMTI